MSEYQYYEFQAIDRPLDDRAMAKLRAITSRADITPTSLINEYHFGDFKGDPKRLMEEYFDAFLYFANWGTHRLMLRLPKRLFDRAVAKPYCVPEVLTAWTTSTHTILDFTSEEEEGDWDEEGHSLTPLIPLRAELLAGDLRCLYLAWLAGVESGMVDEEEPEPPIPAGLQDLSAPLTSLAEFLRLDPVLIKIAAVTSVGASPTGPSATDILAWVAALPEAEKNQLLLKVVQGNDPHLGSELLVRFRQSREPVRAPGKKAANEPARRTAGELLKAHKVRAEEHRRLAADKLAADQARLTAKKAKDRAKYLDSLVGREAELWRQVEAAIESKKPTEYDRAITLLHDLRDLAAHLDTSEATATRIRQIRERYRTKSSFIRRLDKAGFVK